VEVSSSNKIAAFAALGLGALALTYGFMPNATSADLSPVPAAHAQEGIRIPAPAKAISEPDGTQVAVFGGGCFWGIEGVFERVSGVITAEPGYSGGSEADANYRFVSAGRTDHAETVRVRYDPKKISYNELLHIFFSVTHDPTQLNRQGPDIGAQYRTAIFPANDAQRAAADAYIAQLKLADIWDAPIATTIEGFSFYPAETYHQDYMKKNPNNPYIVAFDVPKIAHLERLFPNNLK